MSFRVPSQVTLALGEVANKNPGSFARLVELTYADMHRLASARLGGRGDARLEAEGLSPTALAHETFERLMAQRETAQNREHFFALATRLMMQLLIDHRRRTRRQRRGGGRRQVALRDEHAARDGGPGLDLSEEMRHAMARLHRHDPRKAEVVTLHALCGLTMERTAELVGISRATAERDWAFARAWLARQARGERSEAADGGTP